MNEYDIYQEKKRLFLKTFIELTNKISFINNKIMKSISTVKNLRINSGTKITITFFMFCFFLSHVLLQKKKCAKIEYNEGLLKKRVQSRFQMIENSKIIL